MTRLSTRQIALVSTFTALLTIVSRLKGFPIVGGQGSIQLTTLFYPLIGIILGPGLGFLTSLLGNLVSWILPSTTVLGLLLVLPGAMASFVSGALTQRVGKMDWRAAAAIMALLNLLWYITPLGVEAPLYPVLHWTALGIILLSRGRVSEALHEGSSKKITIAVALSSFVATMADHMSGNIIFISALGLVIPLKTVEDALSTIGLIGVTLGIPSISTTGLGGLFMAVLPISAIERAIITVGSTIIGASVIKILSLNRLAITKKPPPSKDTE
jgi:uncharacterized membrane protein